MTQQQIDEARRLVEGVLRGDITRDSAPHLFDDDAVMFSVTIVERNDAEWLLGQLGDARNPLAGRLTVARELATPAVRPRAEALLRAEGAELVPGR